MLDEIKEKSKEIEIWLKKDPKFHDFPFTLSLDIRRNATKYTVIDANIFPSGHNNIAEDLIPAAATALKNFVLERGLGRKIAVFPEFMTKNRFYGDNLSTILTIIEEAGMEGTLYWREGLDPPQNNWGFLPFSKTALQDSDWIWLNNDLSSGLPQELDSGKPIFPPPQLGWYQRKKSHFFDSFNGIVLEIEKEFKINCDQLKIRHRLVSVHDLYNDADLKKLYEACCDLDAEVNPGSLAEKKSYFIKNNQGTFGLGVLGITDPKELLILNMRKRQNLSLSKDRNQNQEFIIQEGIPSTIVTNSMTCEEILMGIGGQLINRFLRCHESRSAFDSLNAKGMKLLSGEPSPCRRCESLLFHISLLAAARELQ